MLAVVEQHDLFGARARIELAALVRIRERDVQGQRGAGGRGAVERHPPLHQRAEHREEASARACDVAGVRAVGGDLAVTVEQVEPRHAHVVEREPAVVDAVEAALDAVVLADDAGQHGALVVADRHEEAVHAVVDPARDELREHRGRLAVQCRVAQVVLVRAAERRVDDELLGVGVVGRGRADGGDIRSVSGLGHRERAGKAQVDDRLQPLLVVLLGAELEDRRPEQPPLDAGLDLQAGVGEHELLEPCEVGAVVVLPAVRLGHRTARSAVLDEQVQLGEHALAVLRHGLALDAPERGVLDHLARLAAGLGPRAEEQIGDRGHIDARLGRLLRGVRCGRGAAGGRALVDCGLLRADGVGHVHHLSGATDGVQTPFDVELPQPGLKASGGYPQGAGVASGRRVVRDAQPGARRLPVGPLRVSEVRRTMERWTEP